MKDTTRSAILALAAQSPPARPPDVDLALRRGMHTLRLRLLACYLSAVGLTAGVLMVGTALVTVARQPVIEPSPPVRTVRVIPDAVVLVPGEVQQLTLRTVAADGTASHIDDGVAWRSSDSTVVDVTRGTGRATAGSPGTTTITATHDGLSATAAVTVLEPQTTVASVEVTPASVVLAVDDAEQLTATVTYSDGTISALDDDVEWRSSDPDVVRIQDAPGLARARAPGAVTVTATIEGQSGSASIQVLPPTTTVTRLEVVGDGPVLTTGESRRLTARATYSDGTTADVAPGVTWRSSDPAVARFEDAAGVVRAESAGTATLTATYQGRTATTRATVREPVLPRSVAVTPTVGTVVLGEAHQLALTVSFSDGSAADVRDGVEWRSDEPTVVQVDESGRATALGAGTATVTATYRGLTARTVIAVDRPSELTSVTVTPPQATLVPGGTVQLGVTATFSDGSSTDVRDGVIWRSDDPDVADVDASGRATGNDAGTATLTATYRGVSAAAAITVEEPVTTTSLTVRPPDADLAPGQTVQLVATATSSDGTTTDLREGVDWRTDDPDVVQVDPAGQVTANGVGRATITASYQGLTAQCVIAVEVEIG